MSIKRFEELENKVLSIIERLGVVHVKWIAKDLNISTDEAFEILEALHYRGDVRGKDYSGWYSLARARKLEN